MFKSFPNRTLMMTRMAPTPMVDFMTRLSKAAATMLPHFDPEHWAWQNNLVSLRDPARRRMLILAFNAVQFQTLGLDPWTDRVNENVDNLRLALEELRIRELRRIGFHCKTYLDLKMSHSEIVDAAFGSYLASRSDLEDVSSNVTDVLLRLFGTEGSNKFDLAFVPQTAEEMKNDFWAWPGIETFNEPKAGISAAQDFFANIGPNRASLTIECEVYRENVSADEAVSFLRNAADEVDRIAMRAVNKYRSYPINAREEE